MSTVKENLIAAKALINTPEKWRKDSVTAAPSCCAIIATKRVARDAGGRGISGMWLALYEAIPARWQRAQSEFNYGLCVGNYNDHPDTTHADIMALFDRAIAAQDGE